MLQIEIPTLTCDNAPDSESTCLRHCMLYLVLMLFVYLMVDVDFDIYVCWYSIGL